MDFAKIIENTHEVDDPIMVVGCPRSGTTLLGRAIAQSEFVGYLEEPGLIGNIYNRVVPLSRALSRSRQGEALGPILKAKVLELRERARGVDPLKQFVVHMVRHAKLPDFDLKPSNPLLDRYGVELTRKEMELATVLTHKYRKLARSSPGRMLRVYLKDFELLAGKSRVLEKTPKAVFHLRSIQRIFPRAKVCHIMRDGTDVAASFITTFGKTMRDPVRHICKLYAKALRIDRQMRESHRTNYLPVRYEALLSNPEAVIRDVFEFLDLPCDQTVLSASKQIRPTRSSWEKLPGVTRRDVEHCLTRYVSAAG